MNTDEKLNYMIGCLQVVKDNLYTDKIRYFGYLSGSQERWMKLEKQ